jgi:hypothetical protein
MNSSQEAFKGYPWSSRVAMLILLGSKQKIHFPISLCATCPICANLRQSAGQLSAAVIREPSLGFVFSGGFA